MLWVWQTKTTDKEWIVLTAQVDDRWLPFISTREQVALELEVFAVAHAGATGQAVRLAYFELETIVKEHP